ncbi:MAG: hypothetical protein EPO58_06525 [Chitinophagaceae bacterium]|nr:MAG: hypothetical protein EPO58_06525 [Chitinophagaceae bacterium]
MKKLLTLMMIAGSLQMAQAQDLNKVQTAYLINKMEDAKTEIDKVMADPKQNTKPSAMYWKAKVYAAVYKDANLRAKYPAALATADEAFKKYTDADPAFALVKEKGAEGFFDMYATSYANGVKLFNDKKWEDAASNFKYAVEYSDFIFKNKWSNASIAFDTTSILYLAYAYQNASKLDDAAKYYSRLADAKVSTDMYIDIYKFLANHYTVSKNEELFKKYLALGRELYPKYAWDEFEIDYMDQNMNLAEKTALYDKDDAAGTLSEVKYLQFADIFVNAHNKDKSMDSATERMYSLKAVDAYKKAYGKNAQNAIAAFNVGVVYYNLFGSYDDAYAQNIRTMQGINADKPVEKDPKKKAAAEAALKAKLDPIRKANADIEKPLNDNLNMSLEWLEKAYFILKDKATRTNTEKSVINKAVDFLANLYAYKRDKVRGKDLKAFDAFEAKYKEFDALHGKY